jgi:hypothetical protein
MGENNEACERSIEKNCSYPQYCNINTDKGHFLHFHKIQPNYLVDTASTPVLEHFMEMLAGREQLKSQKMSSHLLLVRPVGRIWRINSGVLNVIMKKI